MQHKPCCLCEQYGHSEFREFYVSAGSCMWCITHGHIHTWAHLVCTRVWAHMHARHTHGCAYTKSCTAQKHVHTTLHICIWVNTSYVLVHTHTYPGYTHVDTFPQTVSTQPHTTQERVGTLMHAQLCSHMHTHRPKCPHMDSTLTHTHPYK